MKGRISGEGKGKGKGEKESPLTFLFKFTPLLEGLRCFDIYIIGSASRGHSTYKNPA